MRKTLTTTALLLALCCPVFAGEMHAPNVAPPPPQTTQEATTQGVMPCPPLVELALSLFGLL